MIAMFPGSFGGADDKFNLCQPQPPFGGRQQQSNDAAFLLLVIVCEYSEINALQSV
jgi:hypothetical protein